MRAYSLTSDRYEDFFRFNEEAYPKRKNIKERFQFQVCDNPLLKDKSNPCFLIACDENGKIIGQFGLNPFVYYFRGEHRTCFCGFDLFVSEKNRGQGAGSSLVKRAINKFKPLFAVGVSEAARNRYAGFQFVGSVCTFVWIRKFRNLVKGCLYLMRRRDYQFKSKKAKKPEFPEILSFKDHIFKQVKSLGEWGGSEWNKNVLEFSRPLNFLKWRFFKRPGYYCYLSDNGSSYFVVRRTNWKGLNFLLLVDYKVLKDIKMFKSILRISKSLARKMRCDGIITMSSHKLFDASLKRNLFFKIGSPSLVLTSGALDIPLKKVEEREFLIMTMADADFEFAFWP